MIINWIRAKRAEYKVKAIFYRTILGIIDNQDKISEYIGLATRLFNELSSVPQSELTDKFVEALSEIIHERNEEKRAENEGEVDGDYELDNVDFSDKDE